MVSKNVGVNERIFHSFPEFNKGNIISFKILTENGFGFLNKVYKDGEYKGCFLVDDGETQFVHVGEKDPYLQIENGFYYNGFDDISATKKYNVLTIDTESNDFLPLIDAYSSTSADLKLPYISTNYRKNSKSAYHYEWHVDPAPDYYQAPGTKNYGINCGAVSAAMLVAFYDSSSLTYSSLLPGDFALKYEDDVEQIQGLIDDLSVRFEIEKYNTGYSGLMVKGLITFFRNIR